jgi:hypothetical protein
MEARPCYAQMEASYMRLTRLGYRYEDPPHAVFIGFDLTS